MTPNVTTGAANRNRGRETEQMVRNYLRAWWPHCDRTKAGAELDRGDIHSIYDRDRDLWAVEVKGPRKHPLPGEVEAWAQEARIEAENLGAPYWLLIVRRAGTRDVGRWWAWLEVMAFAELVGAEVAEGRTELLAVPLSVWVALTRPEPF